MQEREQRLFQMMTLNNNLAIVSLLNIIHAILKSIGNSSVCLGQIDCKS
jgi:hypothetical protein